MDEFGEVISDMNFTLRRLKVEVQVLLHRAVTTVMVNTHIQGPLIRFPKAMLSRTWERR